MINLEHTGVFDPAFHGRWVWPHGDKDWSDIVNDVYVRYSEAGHKEFPGFPVLFERIARHGPVSASYPDLIDRILNEVVLAKFMIPNNSRFRVKTIPEILAMDAKRHDATEYANAESFVDGDQWDVEIAQRRVSQGRPVPVLNQLKGIIGWIGRSSNQSDCTTENMERVKVIVYRIGREPQRCYNYIYAALLEKLKDAHGFVGAFGGREYEKLDGSAAIAEVAHDFSVAYDDLVAPFTEKI